MDVTKRVPRRNMPPIPAQVAERAATRYVVDDAGCWLSTYSRASHGYAQIGWQGPEKNHGTTAHRAAWTHHNGPIPDGATIDHTCHVRPCVNPAHLRLLTLIENASDGGARERLAPVAAGKVCYKGHEMQLYASGAIRCRTCVVDRQRAKRRQAA